MLKKLILEMNKVYETLYFYEQLLFIMVKLIHNII